MRQRLELHQGRLVVESAPGQGTSVKVILPVAVVPALPAASIKPHALEEFRVTTNMPVRIALVDDHGTRLEARGRELGGERPDAGHVEARGERMVGQRDDVVAALLIDEQPLLAPLERGIEIGELQQPTTLMLGGDVLLEGCRAVVLAGLFVRGNETRDGEAEVSHVVGPRAALEAPNHLARQAALSATERLPEAAR